jgi:diguanylate cyclase (GGDEF)-like protein/PAS domain S-box-containing protein
MPFLDEFISKRSIRTLTAILIACVTVPAVAVVLILGLHLYSTKQDDVAEQSMELARVAATYHQQVVLRAQSLLETIADLPAIKGGSASEIEEILRQVVSRNPQYVTLTLVRPDGFLFASSTVTDTSINYSDRDNFQQAMSQRRFVVGQATQSRLTNRPILPFAVPVIDSSGTITGVLQAALSLDEYEKFFSAMRLAAGTRFIFIDNQGTRLFRYPHRDISPVGERVSQQVWDAISGISESSKTFRVNDKTGQLVTHSYIRIVDEKNKRSELGILVGILTPSFFNQVWPVIAWTVFALVFIAASAMAIGYFLNKRILITGLVALEGKTSEIVRSGELVRVDMVPGCAEVVALAKSFNRMVEFLKRGKEGRDRAEHALSDAVTWYQTLMATASDAIHILDQDGDLVQFSQSFLDMLGYSKEEASCLNVRDWDAQVPAHRVAESINILMREPGTFETKHRRKDGTILEVEISAKGVMLSGRRYLYASARDITRRKRIEEALRESEERSRRLFEHAPVGIYRSTMDGQLITSNVTHARIHGFVSQEELRKHLQDGTRSLFADPSQHGELRRLLREHGSVKGYESQRRRKDGSIIWVASNAHLIDDPTFEEPVIEGFVVDISDSKRSEEELTRLATTDPLTGVSNRRLFFDRGAKEFSRSHRHGLPLALLMLDIDHFKAINDTYGHTCGDLVLQIMAAQCMEILRAEDLFGRLGGEEFAALLTHTDLLGAQRTAGRLLDALAGLEIPCEESVIRFTVSIGVAVLDPSDSSIEDLLLRADNAMYRAKRAGRNCVC